MTLVGGIGNVVEVVVGRLCSVLDVVDVVEPEAAPLPASSPQPSDSIAASKMSVGKLELMAFKEWSKRNERPSLRVEP
jgi:hypothetical protein